MNVALIDLESFFPSERRVPAFSQGLAFGGKSGCFAGRLRVAITSGGIWRVK